MSFIAVQPSPPSSGAVIKNSPFWPDVDLAQMREAVRLDGTVTEPKLQHAVTNAIIQINLDLAPWRLRQQAAGYEALQQVPADLVNEQSVYVSLYFRAVYCWAKANLIERYADFDSTAKGAKDAEDQNNTITDLYRDARFAIRDILGVSHVTAELI
ncbi:head completion/stabilization protein [uncultured Rheinheimera sp.]|uniref:head completion/stabilization protein n=1 Tax=uncultured Rheinheimera sp. TaxID=400532 RepID=UPI0025982726|nr:head completion/stabilization protein [uncultured Rheinheimera sp.]